jgi:hypothetical protein
VLVGGSPRFSSLEAFLNPWISAPAHTKHRVDAFWFGFGQFWAPVPTWTTLEMPWPVLGQDCLPRFLAGETLAAQKWLSLRSVIPRTRCD